MVRLDFGVRGSKGLVALVAVALWLPLTGCPTKDPLFCCSTIESCEQNGGSGPITPCTDPERPYCDDDGFFGLGRTCVADPMGQPCRGPENCSPERPFCIDQICVECENDAQCAAGTPVCNESTHLCQGCSLDEDCTATPDTPRCLVDEATCVACMGSEDCGGTTPICVANACVECAGLEDCGGTKPICDANACRGCAADLECASDACDKEGGACFDEPAVFYVATNGLASGTCTRDQPCNSISAAIGQVTGGRDIIKVVPGTYQDQVVIDGITVTILADGVTVQLAAPNQPVVSIANGGGATIEGITVTGGAGIGGPSLVDCDDANSLLRLRRSMVIGNIGGGGISISDCEFSLVNNVIANNVNVTSAFGGGVSISQVAPTVLHEFSFNTVTGNGGRPNSVSGVVCAVSSGPLTFSNNIVYGNLSEDGRTQVGSAEQCSWTHSDIGPGASLAGDGNISTDPQFVEGGFHLDPSSPARNAADPTATVKLDIDGDVRPEGKADMGADEIPE